MINVQGFATLFLGFILFNSSLQAKEEIDSKRWLSIIEQLNSQPKSALYKQLDLSKTLDMDFLARHFSNVKELKNQWRLEKKKYPKKNRKELRPIRNEFLHQKAKKLNIQTVQKPLKTLLGKKEQQSSFKRNYKKLAASVLDAVHQNPVTHYQAIGKYDQGGHIGFCFARALLVHHLLLKNGVSQGDIFKIFAMGEMIYNRQLWNFHVAVVVRDDDHGFIVVDPLVKRPMPYLEWLQVTERYDVKKTKPQVRFYLADARKFLPATGEYTKDDIFQPFLKSFFVDMGKFMHASP